MAGFILKEESSMTRNKKVRIASQAYTIGDAVMLDRTSDAVDVVPATSSTTTANIYGVAMETVTSSATEVLITLIERGQVWESDATNTSSTNHNYQRMVLGANAHTVNNTGTDNAGGIFLQTGYTGTASAKKILGEFIIGADITA